MTQPTNTTEFQNYYSALLPLQFQKPNAIATIETEVYPVLMPQDGGLVTDNEGDIVTDSEGYPVTVLDPDAAPILPLALLPAFNLATAVGQQLQFIAEGIGAKNYGYNLSGQYVTLPDSQYRLLLAAVQGKNYLVATTAAIQSYVAQYFSGILRVKDELDMRMSYQVLVSSIPNWVALFISQGFLPRPLGVALSLTTTVSFFGCITYSNPTPAAWVKSACTYSAPVTSSFPILLYSDGLTP